MRLKWNAEISNVITSTVFMTSNLVKSTAFADLTFNQEFASG